MDREFSAQNEHTGLPYNHPSTGPSKRGGSSNPTVWPVKVWVHMQIYLALRYHYDEPSFGNLYDFDKIGTSDIKIKGQKTSVW